MNIKLDDGQIEAVHKLSNGKILNGDTGSGKSRVALAYYYLYHLKGKIKINGIGETKLPLKKVNLIIITTARKRDNLEWDKELSDFGLSKNKKIAGHNIIIDSWNNIKKYKDYKDYFFIFDEQRLIGSGVWVKSFLKIAKNNTWIILSATPGDTWSDYIPCFIANGFYKNKTEFSEKHIVYKRMTNFYLIDKYINVKKLEFYKNKIIVKMDSLRKIDVEDIICNVNYDHLSYKEIRKIRWNPYTNKPIKNISELCYILRKIVNSDLSRQNALLDILNKHNKVLIFYNFTYELEILKAILNRINMKYSEWNGIKHEEIPKGDKWCYLLQYSANAEGWNCTDTNVIVFFSQTYSYKVLKQAKGRIYRKNTLFNKLYYYSLVSKAPIDIAISRALKNKKQFNERSFTKGINFAKKTFGMIEEKG